MQTHACGVECYEFILQDLNVGALGKQVIELKERQVSDIMTPLDKVFMVDYNDKLDFDQLAKIMECGHSRYRCHLPHK